VGSVIDYEDDRTYTYYLNNLQVEMDSICMPAAQINMLATVYMVGVGIGAFAFSWLPDYFGRRATLIYCGLVTVPAQLAMTYWPDYYTKLVCFALIALFFINKTVCFNYMFELTDS